MVGRQFRASKVGGEQRLNLVAQCVLNLIRRFSGIDHFEVELFRHFVELLDQNLSQITNGKDEGKILGPIEEWSANGLTARRKGTPENLPRMVAEAKRIISNAPSALAQAVESVTAQKEWVIVQFRSPEQLKQTSINDRIVECLLYQ